MRLRTDQFAPAFDTRDVYGQRVALTQFVGRKLLLSFYRAAVCPLCNLRMLYLMDRYEEYRRQGLSVVAFFESSPKVIHHYLDRHHAPFPVIADLDRQVYSLYGLESSWLGSFRALLFRQPTYLRAHRRHAGGGYFSQLFMDGKFGRLPADFLIGPDLRIQVAYYGRDAGDFMRFATIHEFLSADVSDPYKRQPRFLAANPSLIHMNTPPSPAQPPIARPPRGGSQPSSLSTPRPASWPSSPRSEPRAPLWPGDPPATSRPSWPETPGPLTDAPRGPLTPPPSRGGPTPDSRQTGKDRH